MHICDTLRWPSEKAQAWHDQHPWRCGFNYVPANTMSYTDMWLPTTFDPDLIDRELALAEAVGFNCLRFVLPFVVWEHEPDAFLARLDDFLNIANRRGLVAMPCLFDDCVFGEDERLKNPWFGPQPEMLAGWYANGWTPSPGHGMVRDASTWPRLRHYVQDVISRHKDDPRVWVWDLYNEPTNGGLGEESLLLAEQVFAWGREVDPTQPLTLGQWNKNEALNELIAAHSDVISFHSYGNAENLATLIGSLKPLRRPLINTEWLCRWNGSTVEDCLPIFRRENVDCVHWGLVNGKTQTHLRWGARPENPTPEVWQHDLYHGDHTPYDERELTLFSECIRGR